MDMTKMMELTSKLATVKPSRYCWVACNVMWALNVFAAYTPNQHQQIGEGCVKLSREAIWAFKGCFPKDQIPDIKIR